MSDLDTLLQQRAPIQAQLDELDGRINELKNFARAEAIAQANEILRAHGLVVENAPVKRGLDKRTKVAPKFRDPISGKTWAGRGRKPEWLPNAVAA